MINRGGCHSPEVTLADGFRRVTENWHTTPTILGKGGLPATCPWGCKVSVVSSANMIRPRAKYEPLFSVRSTPLVCFFQFVDFD
jgi:hypothetical protein